VLQKDKGEEQKTMQNIPYRQALGSLLWLTTNTRPDISYAVHQVARRTSDPRPEDWAAIKKIFRYLEGTKDLGITYKKNKGKMEMTCYSDSDWAGDSTRHTTACGIICIAGAPVAWTVRLLKNMALSSFKGELMAFSETGKLGTYVLNLLNQIGIGSNIERPIPMLGDNDGARLALTRNGHTKRSRHVEVRHFWLREKVTECIFSMERISTEENIADIGTKPLAAKQFTILRDKLVVNNKELQQTQTSDPEAMTAQWDLSTAFLHAKIDHTVYMEQPELPQND